MSWPLSVSDQGLAPFLPGAATNRVQVGNGAAVRVVRSVLEAALEFTHHFLTEHMLDFFGILMDMVRVDAGGVG
jgi:hypothetical protein